MSSSETGVLAVTGELTVNNAAARWRELRPHAANLRMVDLAGVSDIDSAGVALIQALRRLAKATHGALPDVRHLPERMQHLCVAHRVDLDQH